MKKYTLLGLILCSVFVPAAGQDAPVQLESLSLQQAVDYSLRHAPEIVVSQLKQKQAENQLSQVKLSNLPEIYATSDLRRNLIIPSTPIPASMINPNAQEGEIMYMRFNTPWTMASGLNLSYDIFNPQTIGKKSEQTQQLKINSLSTQIAENNTRWDVSQSYIDCVIAKAQLETVTADTAYYHDLLQETSRLYGLEKVSLIDHNNALLQYHASLERFQQAQDIFQQSKVSLLLNLGIQPDEGKATILCPSDDIQALYVQMTDKDAKSPATKLDVARQNEVLALSQLKRRNVALKYAPTLSLSGYYGANFYDRQLSLGNADRWFGNSFVALSLRVPISRSLNTAKEVEQWKIQEQMDRETLRQMQNADEANAVKSLSRIETLKKTYLLKQADIRLIDENMVAQHKLFEKGYMTSCDFSAALLKLQNARQQYLKAAYDVLSAVISLEKITIK